MVRPEKLTINLCKIPIFLISVSIFFASSDPSSGEFLLLFKLKEISKIMITASGGPFREKTFKELSGVTLQDALKHPTWSMGTKITIDSATLVNKCLELIEAHYLFQIPESQIEILVHPQSIIHSMVTFIDGSTIAQMSNPNMEVPIANALGLDQRLTINFEPIKIQTH